MKKIVFALILLVAFLLIFGCSSYQLDVNSLKKLSDDTYNQNKDSILKVQSSLEKDLVTIYETPTNKSKIVNDFLLRFMRMQLEDVNYFLLQNEFLHDEGLLSNDINQLERITAKQVTLLVWFGADVLIKAISIQDFSAYISEMPDDIETDYASPYFSSMIQRGKNSLKENISFDGFCLNYYGSAVEKFKISSQLDKVYLEKLLNDSCYEIAEDYIVTYKTERLEKVLSEGDLLDKFVYSLDANSIFSAMQVYKSSTQ